MKKWVVIVSNILLIWSLATLATAQNVVTHGRISNTTYSYEISGEKYTALYQNLRFEARFPTFHNLRLNLSGRALSNLNSDVDLTDEQRYHAYRASLSGNGLLNGRVDFEIGRQFLNPGLPYGSIDGVNLVVHPRKKSDVQFFGGVQTHLYRSLKVYKTDEAKVMGFSWRCRQFSFVNWQALYLNQANSDETRWEVAGLNLNSRPICGLGLALQTHYDMVNDRLHRLYVSGRYDATKRVALTANFKQQYPQVFGGTFFKDLDDVEAYQQAGVGTTVQLSDKYWLAADYQSISIGEGDETGQRVLASLNDAHGSLGISSESGDLGEEFGVMIDYGFDLTQKLMLSAHVDYSSYNYLEGADDEKQWGNAIRAAYRFSSHLSADVEYQWLDNAAFESDQRLLTHLNLSW